MSQTSVYAAIITDHHADVEVNVFQTAGAAIEWAQTEARSADRHGVLDEELTDLMRRDGWLYYGCYSDEDDFIYVIELELYRCPTPCDSECDAPCHEVHEVTYKREHNPRDCRSRGPS